MVVNKQCGFLRYGRQHKGQPTKKQNIFKI
jgi:hypothetical protein